MSSSMEVDVFEGQSSANDLNSLMNRGEMLLREGRLNEAFQQFSKLYRTGHVDSSKLGVLITSLVEFQTRKLEQERVKHVSTLAKETFLCLICHDFLCDPVSMSCGHTFCRVCLDEDNSKVCQKCGITTLDQRYSLNVLLASTLAKWFPARVKASELKRQGKSYLKAGEPLQAMDSITKSLEMYANDPKSYLLRCEAYSTIGLVDEAQEDASKACALKPFEAKGFFTLGMTMKLCNRPDEAFMAFLRALALDSSNTECRELLTETLQKLLSPISAEEQLNMVAGRSKSIFNQTETPLSLKLSVPEYDVNFQEEFDVDQSLKDVDDFECKLCFGLLYRPVTTPCGHTFCLECLERTMDHTLLCPCCRFKLNDFLASGKHKIVTEIVEYVLDKYFPQEYQQRKKSHDEKLQQLACVGQKQHFEVPMFVCAFSVPDIKCPLHIFEPRYRLMIRHCLESGLRQFGMCLSDQHGSYVDYGTMMEIISVEFFPDGRSVIDTIGGRRFHVLSRGRRDGYDTAVVEWVSDNLDEFEDDQDLHELLSVNCSVYRLGQVWFSRLGQDQQSCILNALGQFPPIDPDPRILPNGPSWIWWLLQAMPLDQKAKLIILSMISVRERLLSLQRFLSILIRMQTKNMAGAPSSASGSPSHPLSAPGPSGLQ